MFPCYCGDGIGKRALNCFDARLYLPAVKRCSVIRQRQFPNISVHCFPAVVSSLRARRPHSREASRMRGMGFRCDILILVRPVFLSVSGSGMKLTRPFLKERMHITIARQLTVTGKAVEYTCGGPGSRLRRVIKDRLIAQVSGTVERNAFRKARQRCLWRKCWREPSRRKSRIKFIEREE